MGLVALWSLFGLLVLTSASWFVAEREMGDAAYYLKRQALWMVASWGLFLQRPSDLGYSDEGYVLPDITVRYV